MSSSDTAISKYLSYILRHKPETIGLTLDKQGWANIDELLEKTTDFCLTEDTIQRITKESNKQRFMIKGNKIRANQGHSLNINLALSPQKPPSILYHGTAIRFLESILKDGILAKNRQYVHLTEQYQTAIDVGKRYGKEVVLLVDALSMHRDGFDFLLTENGVWLVDIVPPKYIKVDTQ